MRVLAFPVPTVTVERSVDAPFDARITSPGAGEGILFPQSQSNGLSTHPSTPI